MFNSYHLVVVNCIAFVFLLTGICIYRFVFPKKQPKFFFILILFSLLPLISLLRNGDYESGDFNIHIYRSIAFFHALQDGQYIPSWAGELNAAYGYPLFIFLNPLPYYFVSFFHGIGFSFIASLKLFLGVCFLTSGIFMYLWSMKTLKNSFAAFTASMLYLFAPYHLVDLHFRATVGETLFFAILPLEFFFLNQLSIKKDRVSIILSAIGYALLIFSHLAMAIFSTAILVVYIFYGITKQKLSVPSKILYICVPFLLGMIFSCFAWMPHVFLSQYTLADVLSSNVVAFPQIHELLYSAWQYGFLFQGPQGQLSYVLGYIHLVIVVLMIILLKTKKNIKRKSEITIWLFILLSIIFLITPYSYYIWKSVHFINAAQFSSRLLLLVSLCTSIIGGYYVLNIHRKNIVYFIILITIVSSILNWGHRRVIPEITDETLLNNLPFSTSQGEGLAYMGNSKWWPDKKKLWISVLPTQHIETNGGNLQTVEISRSTIKHEYLIATERDVLITENTIYFPGWEAYIDNKKVPILTEKLEGKPFIYFQVSKGIHAITIVYHDVHILFFSKIISIFSFVIAVIFLLSKTFTKFNFLYSRR